MNDLPVWLPPLEVCEGDWLDYIEVIYSFFRNDFLEIPPDLFNKNVRPIIHPIANGKEDSFWHIIQGTSGNGPDHDRCQRIRWPKPIIQEITRQDVKWWRTKENGKRKFKLALDDFSYLVVLFERKTFFLLGTAFPVFRTNYKNQLERQYNREKE